MNPKLSLVIGIICIAFSPIFVRLAGVDAVTSSFYRIFIGWLLLAPYCIIGKKLNIGRKDMWLALLAGVVFATDIAVWNTSILMINVTVSTLIANLAPVWVGLLSFIFLRQRSGRAFWLGTLIAIAGMVVLVGYRDLLALKFNLGMVLALMASFLYAIYLLISKGLLQRVSTITFMFYNMLGASVFLVGVITVKGTNLTRFAPSTWFYFIAMGAICQVAGWLTINYAISKLAATKTAVALLSQTVVTGVIAAILLHEKLAAKEVIGSMIVLAGIGVTFIKLKGMQASADQ